MNPLIEMAVDMANALSTLKGYRSARLRSVREGVEITMPGKPTLLLTHEAARRYAQEMDEAE